MKVVNFYGIPKVHKSQIFFKPIQEQNSEYIKGFPQHLKLQPNVVGYKCSTEHLRTLGYYF